MRQLTSSEANSDCVGILGAAFGHKWVDLTALTFHHMNQNARSCWAILPKYAADDFLNGERQVCKRCGLVTGVNHDKQR